MSARYYDKELREKILKLHFEEQRSIASLSKEFGMSSSTILRWVEMYRNSGRLPKGKWRHRT